VSDTQVADATPVATEVEPTTDTQVADPPPLAEPEADTQVADPAPVTTEVEPGTGPEAEDEPAHEDEPTGRRFAALPGWLTALLTGLLVGAAGALLTYLSLRGCDAVRGTESCGGGPGAALLVVILVLMVLLGAVVLTALRLPDPRATSFLAIGVLCVVALLMLMDQLFSPSMFVVVPVLTAASYVLAHGVTTAFIEPRPEPGPEHDVR
jgi:hypothetical protein